MADRGFMRPSMMLYCGLRLPKALYERLNLRCTGMGCNEMIIKFSLNSYNRSTDHVASDGRTAHAPHLKTYRDAGTLRFFLIYSPRGLFYLPGILW
jgi:hypothetical protein